VLPLKAVPDRRDQAAQIVDLTKEVRREEKAEKKFLERAIAK
jgi:hypothetical protein